MDKRQQEMLEAFNIFVRDKWRVYAPNDDSPIEILKSDAWDMWQAALASTPRAAEYKCNNCKDEEWVCENHEDHTWDGECCGGAGSPCPVCNRKMACEPYITRLADMMPSEDEAVNIMAAAIAEWSHPNMTSGEAAKYAYRALLKHMENKNDR